MCGIAGAWQDGERLGDGAVLVRRMTDALAHRGPDASGFWDDRAAGLTLGHRRLSIVDLSPEGAQPMVSASGRFVMVFNGEIYNYRRIRETLHATGVRFRGHSDTEVLLAAMDAWGILGALERADGMFAIAVWDTIARTLTLARDRAGEKPLYYGRAEGALLFASELKALAVVPGALQTLSPRAIAGFLRLSYVPGPLSVWENVWKLEPGHVRTFRAGGPTQGEPHAYWRLDAAIDAGRRAPVDIRDPFVHHALRDVLLPVVGEQMVADVPLGALLSGGLDSSLVVALMQAQASRPVRTFTIGFNEAAFDESPHARAVAQHLGTDHTELRVTADDARAVIPLLPEMYDEPFADSSAIPTFLVSKLARAHVTVALSGDGGDETFAGYTRYLWAQQAWRALRPMPSFARSAAARLIEARSPAAWDATMLRWGRLLPARFRTAGTGTKLHKVARLVGAGTFDEVYEHLISNWWDGHTVMRPAQERMHAMPEWLTRTESPRDPLSRMQYRDFHAYLVDDVLVKVDRASMAVSLETRAPFLDRRVVEFAWRVRSEDRVQGGQGKWLARRLLYDYVPSTLVDRPKQGFGIPVDAWLRGPLADWAGDLVQSVRPDDPHLDASAVRQVWATYSRSTTVAAAAMWNLLMFLAWRERWCRP